MEGESRFLRFQARGRAFSAQERTIHNATSNAPSAQQSLRRQLSRSLFRFDFTAAYKFVTAYP
jgi:hypothetical protein